MEYNIYGEIAERTNGNVYIGVVGPVRTGKSTFVKRFMDLKVIPNIRNGYDKARAIDELPQSGTGRTIMTAEPKFVPNEAVEINMEDNISLSVRMIDCVGYIVKEAIGYIEDNAPRMVNTPWFDSPIPFEEAAEVGTRKVIQDHSTIGIVVTTDGSITEIPRDAYIDAERRVIEELKARKKPFAVLLNSTRPDDPETKKIAAELAETYQVPVKCVDALNMRESEVNDIMNMVLMEFPVNDIYFDFPSWVDSLDDDYELKQKYRNLCIKSFSNIRKLREARDRLQGLMEPEIVENAFVKAIKPGSGFINIQLTASESLFYKTLCDISGLDVSDERKLMNCIKELSNIQVQYKQIEYALHQAKTVGYGIVMPALDEMSLEKPEIIKQAGRFGVKLRATAPSIHLIRADIETEVAPLVGTEKQSEELAEHIINEFEEKPELMWQSNIFGKSLHDLVIEGLNNKLLKMPEDTQIKLRETLERILNESNGSLICIIL
jgi:stage IV sporulation protein A